jgi:uncharacterized protein (TIGR02996 family)
MAGNQRNRRIVVEDVTYRWSSTGTDGGIGIAVVAMHENGRPAEQRLVTGVSHKTLVVPSLVRRIILEGHAAGWDPFRARGRAFVITTASEGADEPDPKRTVERHEIPVTEEQLFAAIRASGDDDAPRLVYADWLLERGDARGEYITLSCAAARGTLSLEEEERMRALFVAHEAEWLGPVADVTRARRWHRGLFDAAQLDRRERGVVAPAIGHPAWRTLRSLDARAFFLGVEDIARIVSDPVFDHLDALALNAEVLAKLAEARQLPRPQELIVFSTTGSLGELTRATLAAVARSSNLRRLHLGVPLTPRDVIALGRPGLSIAVAYGFAELGTWQRELDEARSPLEEVRLVRAFYPMFERRGVEAILQPNADRGWSRLEIRWTAENDVWGRDTLAAALANLESNALTHVSAEGPLDVAWDARGWLAALATSARAQRRTILGGLLT